MLRLTAAALLSAGCKRQVRPFARSCAQAENSATVDSLRRHSVDVQKIRRLKGWVLSRSPAYVEDVAALLRDLGARRELVARVLEQCPEAVLCPPEDVRARTRLWMSVCSGKDELLAMIATFPAAFFASGHGDNQKANVQYLRGMRLNRRVVKKLMAAAPQSFSNPVAKNRQMVDALRETYVSLGGGEGNADAWLRKTMSQNPFVLLASPRALEDNVAFLRDRGFSSAELLQLLSKLRGFIAELNPDSVQATLEYCREALQCSPDQLKEIVLKCPSVISFSVPTLADRLNGLLKAGVTLSQVKGAPAVLELTAQIVTFRLQKLRSCGYDVATGSLESVSGTKKDFEKSFGRLQLRQERPLFNPVVPLQVEDD